MSWSDRPVAAVRRFRGLAALVCALALAGCGFQLRGAPALPAEMSTTYIATPDRHSLYYRKLQRELRANGVEIVEDPAQAGAVFNVLRDETGQRVLSVSARNVPREFQVYYTVTFSLETEGRTMLAPREQTRTRDYIWDETLVLGKAREEDLLRDAVAAELVRVTLIQLSALERNGR